MTTASISVLHADMADLERLTPLFDAYRVFYGLPSAVADCRYFLMNRLMNEDSLILLAVEGQAEDLPLLGFAQFYPTFSSLALNTVWNLNDLYVVPEARKRGVAKKLIRTAEALLTERGDVGMTLETAKDNVPAKTLYQSLGFQQETVFDKYHLTFQAGSKLS